MRFLSRGAKHASRAAFAGGRPRRSPYLAAQHRLDLGDVLFDPLPSQIEALERGSKNELFCIDLADLGIFVSPKIR